MALTPTDLPEPVVPATSRCGMRARSTTIGSPPIVLPSVIGNCASARRQASLSSSSRRSTDLAAMVGQLDADRVAARTLSPMRAETRAHRAGDVVGEPDHARRFGAARRHQLIEVTTGPGRMSLISPLTPKSASTSSSSRALPRMAPWDNLGAVLERRRHAQNVERGTGVGWFGGSQRAEPAQDGSVGPLRRLHANRREALRHRAALALGGEIEVGLAAGLIAGRCRRRVPTSNSRPIEPWLGSARSLGCEYVRAEPRPASQPCLQASLARNPPGSPPGPDLPEQCVLALRQAERRWRAHAAPTNRRSPATAPPRETNTAERRPAATQRWRAEMPPRPWCSGQLAGIGSDESAPARSSSEGASSPPRMRHPGIRRAIAARRSRSGARP